VWIERPQCRTALLASAVVLAGSMVASSWRWAPPVANVLIVFGATPFITALLAALLSRRTAASPHRAAMAMASWARRFPSQLAESRPALGMAIARIVVLCMSSNYVIVRHRRDVGMAPALLLAGVMLRRVALPFAQPGNVTASEMAGCCRSVRPARRRLRFYIASLIAHPGRARRPARLLELVLGRSGCGRSTAKSRADLHAFGRRHRHRFRSANVWLDSRSVHWLRTGHDPVCKRPPVGHHVVDLSAYLAGPIAHTDGEMGARVIKVEQPRAATSAAPTRAVRTRASRPTSPRSIAASRASRLDLKRREDAPSSRSCSPSRRRGRELPPRHDGEAGYGWEQLHAKYPKLIYASASGFGHTGPNSRDPAYDMVSRAWAAS